MIDLSSNILFEDGDIVALNKPAGLIVHSDGKTKEPTVSDWFVKEYPEAEHVGETLGEIARPGIVHRIDRETSGVLLLAKTPEGHACLKEQFHERTIDKKYQAFIYGVLKEDHGSINLPIGRSPSDFRKWSAERGARGEKREALTYYQVLKKTPEVSFVQVKPKTGRTHQIRVHFKALQHPVVCDSLYAKTMPPLLGFKRLALHAREITFLDIQGAKKTVIAPYPDDFKQAIEQIG